MARPCTFALPLLLASALALAAAEPVPYAVDVGASRVRVHLGRAGMLKFLGHDHEIGAPLAAGTVTVVSGDLARSTVRLSFDAPALAIVPGTEPAGDVAKVEGRMRGPEVLNAALHPAIVFLSTSVTGEETRPGHFRLLARGMLALKGRSFPVEVPVEVQLSGDDLRATGEVKLRLRALGIEPPSVASVVNVANDFRVKFDLLAHRAPP
ncbi:MAG: YceI family protein [Vicinamibacteria bacterium]|nr:YceI family protein [Vicinamibacteria bacterium]